MTPQQYAAAQAQISAAISRYVVTFARGFLRPALNPVDWLRLLTLLFPEVARQRQRSAELGRAFYDSQRRRYHPNAARHDEYLVDYHFDWFAANMAPARSRMSQADSADNAAGVLALHAVREVENGGRRQIIRAVQGDTASVQGWARVATGRETCAWCLMLVSRGPVYSSASTAGIDLDDTTARQMIAAGQDVSEFMSQWHPGCDCKVVPVFRRASWPGQAAARRAEKLWTQATREAQRRIDAGEAANLNREAQNALRRRLDHGDINPTEYAGIAA